MNDGIHTDPGWLAQKLIREAAQARMAGIELGWDIQQQKVMVKIKQDGKEHYLRFSPEQAHHFGKGLVHCSKAANGSDPAKTMLQELSEMQAKNLLLQAEVDNLHHMLGLDEGPATEDSNEPG